MPRPASPHLRLLCLALVCAPGLRAHEPVAAGTLAADRRAPARAGPYAAWLDRRAAPSHAAVIDGTESAPLGPAPARGPDDDAPGRQPHKVWTTQLDQDLFAPHNEDRDYTQGLSMGWYEELAPGHDVDFEWPMGAFQGWLDDQARDLGLAHDEDATVVEGRTGGALAYTPDEIERRDVVKDDRPYASLLYYSTKRVETSHDRAVGTELRVGVLGSVAAEIVQKFIHATVRSVSGSRNPKEPHGWDNQISDGGEPTLLYRVSDERVLAGDPGDWDLALLRDANLGYQVDAGIGLAARAGRVRNGIESLPFDPIGRATHVPTRLEGDAYWWAAARVRLVAYDALLQGQFRHSDHHIPADELERLVGHAAAGFTWAFTEGWQASYSLNARTRQSEHPSRFHFWGGITLTGRY